MRILNKLWFFQVPPKFEGFGGVFDIDRLKHYNQPFGYDAQKNLDDQDNINTINPAAFLTDDEEKVLLKLNQLMHLKSFRSYATFSIIKCK